MKISDHYVIRGGVEGRERLRVLDRVMQASTHSLLDRLGIGVPRRDGASADGSRFTSSQNPTAVDLAKENT